MARQLLKALAKGLFGRVLAYGAFVLGFWLLYQGFSKPSPGLGVLGGLTILVAAYLMVLARKSDPAPDIATIPGQEEDRSGDSFGDSLNGSDPGSKLPP